LRQSLATCGSSDVKPPDVILLNGAPSAGKSQLTLALQARLPFVRMGIDDFIWERVPASWFAAVQQFLRESPDAGAAVEYGTEPPKLWRAYHRAVRACVVEGLGVVVDDAIVTREMLDDWMRALDGIDVFFVGVHCSVEELILRERARRDRVPGSAVAAMKRVHANAIYDLEVDSTATPSSALAAQIIVALETRSGPSAFERMRPIVA
jgi:chloramphenicol 3-O phosphotransferase